MSFGEHHVHVDMKQARCASCQKRFEYRIPPEQIVAYFRHLELLKREERGRADMGSNLGPRKPVGSW